MSTRSPALLLTFLLGACSEAGFGDNEAAVDVGDSSSGGDGTQPEDFQLRLDVYPSGDNPDLLQQSIILDEVRGALGELQLAPTVVLEGTITGFDASPHVDVVVPGQEDVPVWATIRVSQPLGISGDALETSEDGEYAMMLPAAEGYVLSVVPLDPALLPFLVDPDLLLSADTTLDVSLDYGAPVWGWVLQSDGSRIGTKADVHLEEPTTGVAGPYVEVDDNGYFMLRAQPGLYRLVLTGESASYLPALSQVVAVEAGTGAEVDVDVGLLDTRWVSGRIVDQDGQPVEQARIRCTSVDLLDANGVATVETESISTGAFSTRLLPGSWRCELIPAFDPSGGLAPTEIVVDVEEREVDLGSLTLPDRILLRIQVDDPSGAPAPNVVVTAQEKDFDNYTYTGTTDVSGTLEIALPPTALDLTLNPSTSSHAITHYSLLDPSEAVASTLSLPLRDGTLFSGRLSAEGAPASYALVEVRDTEGNLYGTTFTDEEGAFSASIELPW